MWAWLISANSGWRWNGALVGIWNAVGLVLVLAFYKDPASDLPHRPRMEILREVDFVGGFLSIAGAVCLMLGLQLGAQDTPWTSATVLVPFFIGVALIAVFFIWETTFAKFPMVPKAIFSKDKRSMIAILLITFFSGGNFFVVLLFWPTQCYNMYGAVPVQVGIRALPIGFGIIGGAFLALILIGVTKGRTKSLMIIFTVTMTAFTGAMSVADTTNLNPTVYAILSLSCIGVGCVIIPASIIAQIICPTELIGTITAITLSIRYLGGAIAFTAYYNVFYAKFYALATQVGVQLAIVDKVSFDYPTLVDLVTWAGEARFAELRNLIATSDKVLRKDAFDIIISRVQVAFADAYRWPYWISIAFGSVCIVCSFFLRDIRKHMEAQEMS